MNEQKAKFVDEVVASLRRKGYTVNTVEVDEAQMTIDYDSMFMQNIKVTVPFSIISF